MSEIEKVDDFIGRRFGKDNQVEVVAKSESKSCRNFYYKVKCSKCAEDRELYGDGVFLTLKSRLLRGKLPCGCSKAPRLSEEQQIIRVKRLCKDSDYEFLGFVGAYYGLETKLALRCNKDGHVWSSTRISNFFRQHGCPCCAATESLLPDDHHISSFFSSGNFPPDTKFSRKAGGSSKEWAVYCPICSNDEFVKAGVCSGVFYSEPARLKRGSRPCRCSINHHWTKEQREYQVRKIISEENLDYEFVCWVDNNSKCTNNSKVILRCSEHGEWKVSLSSFTNHASRCPSCASRGYNRSKEGHLYVLRITGEDGSRFTGYGVSNNPEVRMRDHKRNLTEFGFSIENQMAVQTSGDQALDIEKMLKSTFPRHPQEVTGFKTEATHYTLYDDVVNFVKERVDNVLTFH